MAIQPEQFLPVCAVSELIPGSGVCALLDGRQVAIFFLPGEEPEVFAIDNRDPVGGASVLSRGIVGDVGGELVVASPLFKQHFSLRTGKCLERADVAVPVYRCRVERGTVMVAL
jgi:nitrite reductase (NADH) small subunit